MNLKKISLVSLKDSLPQICDNGGMKLKVISRLLRVLTGRKDVADSDQHLQARVGFRRIGGSGLYLQRDSKDDPFERSGNPVSANAGRKDAARQNGSVANAGRNGLDLALRSEEFDLTLRSEELGERAMPDGAAVNPYSPVPEKSKFERRLEAAKNPRRRKHKLRDKKGVAFVRPASHLEALLDDMGTDERVFGRDCTRKFFPRGCDFTRPFGAEVLAKAGMAIAAAAVMDVGESVAKKLREKQEADEREARLAVRRKYYGAEQAKRDERNAAIRAAVPPPENRMPSAAELLDAYSRRHDGEEAKLRFGRLMIDLEEYVRCQVVREGARIVGTTGGVQEWLERNCPELAKHYHTCQRFKRKAQEDPTLSERRD